jgi:hypothetical protein
MSAIRDKIFDRMLNYFPAEGLQIKSKHITFANVQHTHKSYAQQLQHATPGTRVYDVYLRRCYDWLVLLKENNIELKPINTP